MSLVTAVLLVVPIAALALVLSHDDSTSVAEATVAHVRRATATPTATASQTAPRSGRRRVLFVGDALLQGYGASKPAREYRARVVRALGGGKAVHAIDARVRTSSQLIRARAFRRTPVGADMDLAIVEIGTSDWRRTGVAAFRRDYGRLLHRIRSASPDARVLCLGVWRPAADAQTRAYDRAIKRECRPGRYIGLTRLFAAKSLRGRAGQQVVGGMRKRLSPPNDRGHARIAQAIAEAVAP